MEVEELSGCRGGTELSNVSLTLAAFQASYSPDVMGPLVVQAPSHWLYQLANAFLLLSYISPNLLALRLLLAAGCVCFALWGVFVLAISVDTLVWNAFFAVVNLTQAGILIYHRRPIQLDPQLEAVYQHFFSKDGLRMSRRDFKSLTQKAYVKALEAGDKFAQRQLLLSTTYRFTPLPPFTHPHPLHSPPLFLCVLLSGADEYEPQSVAVWTDGRVSVSHLRHLHSPSIPHPYPISHSPNSLLSSAE